MWEIKDGKRVENTQDILYSMSILDSFDELIKKGIIPESAIFGYYNQIMKLNKEDRVLELDNLAKQITLQSLVFDEVISEKVANEIFEAMKKGKFVYKINTDEQTIDCIAGNNTMEKSKHVDDELLNEETVLALYKFAERIRLDTYQRYIFFMEMLGFDDKDRAKEVETAYNNLIIEDLVKKGFLAEDEGEKVIEKIGQSQLLENLNNVLEEMKENEEEFEDEDVTENTI